MQKPNLLLSMVCGFVATHLAIYLFGHFIGPLLVLGTAFFVMVHKFIGLQKSFARLTEVVDLMGIPDGSWLIKINHFTHRGCQTTEQRLIGPFSKVVQIIGLRTPEEIERIRLMVLDSLEGGYNWITLYNPIGITKAEEASAPSTFTLQYQPLPRQSD